MNWIIIQVPDEDTDYQVYTEVCETKQRSSTWHYIKKTASVLWWIVQ